MIESFFADFSADIKFILFMIALLEEPSIKNFLLFQTKAAQQREKSSLGLLSYPVLMAADVLLYKYDAFVKKEIF